MQSTDQQPYGYSRDDSMHTVHNYIYDGAKLGLSQFHIQQALAVEFAIESGELPLPWSQEEIENALTWGYGPTIQGTQALMATHPEFTSVACGWAYHKDYNMFPLLHEFRTDGL